jgi:Ca-activated chloride channel family protein
MAIAQFFRQLTPNDMPVGGTAIGRALAKAEQLLDRDPKSHKHKRIIVLITDGEDLEGNPVSVAQTIGQRGTLIHVVQIGGRTTEPVPDVDGRGTVHGYRKSKNGRPMMTSLSSEGEKQLVEVAKAGNGTIIRAVKGSTGIEEITRKMRHMMHAELSERVETLYADVYAYPLGAALLLLFIETFIGVAPRRSKPRPEEPSEKKPSRAEVLKRKRRRGARAEVSHG